MKIWHPAKFQKSKGTVQWIFQSEHIYVANTQTKNISTPRSSPMYPFKATLKVNSSSDIKYCR